MMAESAADCHPGGLTIQCSVRRPGDRELPSSPTGQREAPAFFVGHGTLVVTGTEATSSYAAGLTRLASRAGTEVREVTRPDHELGHRHRERLAAA
jgi:hypothetical protein